MTIQKTATINTETETPTAIAGHLTLFELEGVPGDVPRNELKFMLIIFVICP